MKQTHQSVALAALLAIALAVTGCKSMHGGSGASGSTGSSTSGSSTSGSSTSGEAEAYGEGSALGSSASGRSGTATGADSGAGAPLQDGSGASGSSGISGSAGSGTGTSSMQDDRGNTAAAKVIPNSTVLAIEALPQSAGITEGDTSMGASGTSGATGSAGSSQSWRVTVRMDDGSTQVVTHSGTPDFRSGDRINVTSGAIQR